METANFMGLSLGRCDYKSHRNFDICFYNFIPNENFLKIINKPYEWWPSNEECNLYIDTDNEELIIIFSNNKKYKATFIIKEFLIINPTLEKINTED